MAQSPFGSVVGGEEKWHLVKSVGHGGGKRRKVKTGKRRHLLGGQGRERRRKKEERKKENGAKIGRSMGARKWW